MIKPVTFQGCFNFNANLYALEVRSRFIDQSKANGYYKGYGNELAAQIVGQKIQIGTGAFLVQGRMCEITAAELVAPQIFDGFVGYVVARIETYHPSDDANCSLLAVVNRTYEAITLEQNDTYAATADNVNTAYELPLYSFEISGTSIVNLKKLINPVADYATIKTIVDEALEKAASAVAAANTRRNTAVSRICGATFTSGLTAFRFPTKKCTFVSTPHFMRRAKPRRRTFIKATVRRAAAILKRSNRSDATHLYNTQPKSAGVTPPTTRITRSSAAPSLPLVGVGATRRARACGLGTVISIRRSRTRASGVAFAINLFKRGIVKGDTSPLASIQ